MYEKLARKAVAAAISGNWNKALELNLQLLESWPSDYKALTRISKAHFELGNIEDAESYAKKAMRYDESEKLAKKLLERFEAAKKNGQTKGRNSTKKPAHTFLEVPGRTKVVPLRHLGNSNIIASLDCGEPLNMVHAKHKVSVNTTDDSYVGRLPDDYAVRINYLVENGNEYTLCVKTANIGDVKVFIKETKRSESVLSLESFPKDMKVAPFMVKK